MAVDKVKPLKIEDSTSGTEMDFAPTEADPTEDYLAAKGVALENDDNTLIDKAGDGQIQFTDTTNGTKSVGNLLDAELEDFDPGATDLVSTKTGPAIREVRDKIDGTGAIINRTWVERFESNGNTGNKWLERSSGETSDTLPFHTAFDVDIYGVNMINTNTNRNVDIEFYVNGTAPGDLVYTLQVRLGVGEDSAHKTTLTNLFTMDINDELSVFVRKVGGNSLSSPEVDVFCRINSNTAGETGTL